jgi:hypothetical protein
MKTKNEIIIRLLNEKKIDNSEASILLGVKEEDLKKFLYTKQETKPKENFYPVYGC